MINWPTYLKTGWWSFSLPGFRDHLQPTTYSLFAYEDLPPIIAPMDKSFTWLLSEPRYENWSLATNGYADGSKADLSRLPHLLAQAQVGPPLDFVAFMQTVSLHERIRSCTACYLELSDDVVRVTKPVDGVLLHFLADQQYILHWYLYASRSGDHCVVVSSETYGFRLSSGERQNDEVDLSHEDVWICAPSFMEFIYRFWLENEIWFRVLHDKENPSPAQKDYLDHYRRLKRQL